MVEGHICNFIKKFRGLDAKIHLIMAAQDFLKIYRDLIVNF